MSEKDLVKELKTQIADLTQDRDDALAKVKTKESRMKQVMIKLEHATSDVQATGHRIVEKDKEIAKLKAKLDTKEELLQDALTKIKALKLGSFTDDGSTTKKTDTDTDDKELD